MELKTVLSELVASLSPLDFVSSIDLRTEAFILKGRVLFRIRGFLEIYFKEQTQTLAVAWIEEDRRTWGVDRDNLRGWHRHPFENPESHQPIPAVTMSEIIREFVGVWSSSAEPPSFERK